MQTTFVHYFVCPCGRLGRAATYALHDCPCGISRKYHSHEGLFSETLYVTAGYPSNVYTYARFEDTFILKPTPLEPLDPPNIPRERAVSSLRRF